MRKAARAAGSFSSGAKGAMSFWAGSKGPAVVSWKTTESVRGRTQ